MTKKEKLIKGNMCNSAIYEAGFQKGELKVLNKIEKTIKEYSELDEYGFRIIDVKILRREIKQLQKEIGEEKGK
jgi:hypothetical protein